MKKKAKKRKIAIVMSGGGMKCVYGVGVLTALVEEYGFTKPDIMIAASGSAGGAAYYLSGQYKSTISAWLALLGSKKLISFGRRKVLDIDYLIDEIFKKKYPFDFAGLRRSPTYCLLATTRVTDGKTIFMKLPKNNSIYECLRAAKAAPVIYGKEIKIRGRYYIDGDFGANTGDLIRKALKEGATDVVIIESNPDVDRNKLRKMILEGLYYEEKLSKKAGLAKAILREMKKTSTFEKDGLRTIIISPSKPLPLSTLSRKKLNLREGFNIGYADAAHNEELQKLLS